MNTFETDKFTNTNILIRTFLPLKRETITALNLMIYMIRGRTEKLESKRDFAKASSMAYGFRTFYGLNGYGEKVAIDIRFQYIRSDYIDEEHYVDDLCFLMDQVLFHPYVDKAAFEEAKFVMSQSRIRQLDDPDSLAILEALKITKESSSLGIPIQGELEDIEKVTFEDVKKALEEFMEAPKYIAVAGRGDKKIVDLLSTLKPAAFTCDKFELIHDVKYQEKTIEKHISQTSLVQIYATHISIDSPLYYPLLVANSILGASPMSLLFENVREIKSYCYSISSALLRFDGGLIIICGTDKDHVDGVIDEIHKQIQILKGGSFDPELLEIAKKDLVDTLIGQEDRPFEMIEQQFADMYLKRKDTSLEKRVAAIESVTMKDIEEAVAGFELATQVLVTQKEDEEVEI